MSPSSSVTRLCVASAVLLATTAVAAPPYTPGAPAWSQYGGADGARTFHSSSNVQRAPVAAATSAFAPGVGSAGAPVVGPGGFVAFIDAASTLRVLGPNGTGVLWSAQLAGAASTADEGGPAFTLDGSLLLAPYNNATPGGEVSLRAYNAATGTLNWTWTSPAGQPITAPLGVAPSAVYVVPGVLSTPAADAIYSITLPVNGAVATAAWAYPAPLPVSAALTVDTTDGGVWAVLFPFVIKFNSTGFIVLSVPLDETGSSVNALPPIILAAAGVVVVVSEKAGGTLINGYSTTFPYGQTCTGNLPNTAAAGGVTACAALSVDAVSPGLVCVVARSLLLTGVETPCQVKQFVNEVNVTNVGPPPTPVVDASGAVVLSDTTTRAVTAYTVTFASQVATTLWRLQLPGSDAPSGPLAIGADGTVYTGSASGALYAIGTPNCTAGYFALGNNSGCVPCPAGSYSAATGFVTSCSLCPAGTASAAVGATSAATCADCAPGSAAPAPGGATTCGACAAGTYAPAARATSCLPCAANCYCPASSTNGCDAGMAYPGFAGGPQHAGVVAVAGPCGPLVSVARATYFSGQASVPTNAGALGPAGGVVAASVYGGLVFLPQSNDLFGVSLSSLAIINNYDNAGERFSAVPAVAPWGTVFAVSDAGVLYAYPRDRGGAAYWTVASGVAPGSAPPPPGSRAAPPAVHAGTRRVFFAAAGRVFGVDGDAGVVLWNITLPVDPATNASIAIVGAPAVDPAGVRLFFGADDNVVRALAAANGTLLWSFLGASFVRAPPSVSPDGRVVWASTDGNNLVALDATTGVYTAPPVIVVLASSAARTAPALAPNVGAIVGLQNGLLFAANASFPSSVRWSVQLDGAVSAPATLDSTGAAFVGTAAGSVYCLVAATGAVVWTANVG